MLRERAAPVAALIAVTAVWGWTFVVVRVAVRSYPVLPFLAIRFAIATLVLSPILLKRGSGFRAGLFPGVALTAGYVAQTEGLRYTTASKAGLLTGLFVVLTPVMAVIVLRRAPRPITLVAAAVALTGTILLVGAGGGNGSQEILGDALEVLTAICFSAHMLLLERFAPGANAARLALSQMVVASLLFGCASLGRGDLQLPSAQVWTALLITGVLASAAAFWVQAFVQQRISASRTAIILAAEPAFATFFGLALAADRFGVAQAIGAALILAAIAGHEIRPAGGALVRSAAT